MSTPLEQGAAFVELRDDTMSGAQALPGKKIRNAAYKAAKKILDSKRRATAKNDRLFDELFGELDATVQVPKSEIAQALPGNLAKLNRAKRASERRKTPSYKHAQKMWHSKNTAANPE